MNLHRVSSLKKSESSVIQKATRKERDLDSDQSLKLIEETQEAREQKYLFLLGKGCPSVVFKCKTEPCPIDGLKSDLLRESQELEDD